jgi:hypothetical protein
MGKRMMVKACVLVVAVAAAVYAQQPMYIGTTIFNVDGNDNNVIRNEYMDGLGRSIQSKLRLSSLKDLVFCHYYLSDPLI